MEQERISSKKGAPEFKWLWLMGLFALVPLVAILAFASLEEGTTPVRRTAQPKNAQQNIGEEHPSREGVPQREGEHPAQITRGERGLSPLSAASVERGAPIKHAPLSAEGEPPEPTYAEENAARLDRFDENARAFDERLTAFEREQGQADVAASIKLEESMRAALEALHPEIRVSASCAVTVCVVELSSPAPIGTMIARISPWIRERTRAATGDPLNPSDENSMRLVLEKADALVEF